MKRRLIIIAVGIFLAMTASSVYAASNLWGPTGLLYYDKAKAYPGYIIFHGGGQGWIMDNEGNVCHNFPYYGRDLYPDGHMLNSTTDEAGNPGFLEQDWDGNIYGRAFRPPDRPELRPHHDQIRIFNNKLNDYTIMLMVSYRDKTVADAIAVGADPDCMSPRDNVDPYDDGIVEFDRAGNIIWEWRFWDHMVQDYDPTKLYYGDPTAPENWGKLDVNVNANTWGEFGMAPDWNHTNSFDYNETLDQLVINSREHGEWYVVDHNLTTEEAAGSAGDFILRWGNPANYGQGLHPVFNWNHDEQIFGTHDIQWIKDYEYPGGPAMPGAGNFLMFDNGDKKPVIPAHSAIFEVNPYDGPMENGVYIWQHEVGYTDTGSTYYGKLSNQVVWGYCATEAGRFNKGMYSRHTSGCNRLPNGNTFMCASEEGHLVEVVSNMEEVTAVDEVVWEWVCPLLTNGTPITWLGPGMDNNISTGRADKYSSDYPGFAGLDLSPKGKFTERAGIEALQDKLEVFMAQ
jgi:hypothetical protein